MTALKAALLRGYTMAAQVVPFPGAFAPPSATMVIDLPGDDQEVRQYGEGLNNGAPIGALLAHPDPADTWLNVDQFADLSGNQIRGTQKTLKNAINGKPWKGVNLVVREVAGVGGHGGIRYEVRVDSLPPSLLARWREQQGIQDAVIEAPKTIPLKDRAAARRMERARWRLQVIQPALKFKKRSPERGAVVESIAQQVLIDPFGVTKTLTTATVRNWLRAYESGGLQALGPKPRKDSHQSLVEVSVQWDQAVALAVGDEQMRVLAQQVRKYMQQQWRSGARGWRDAQRKTASRCVELLEDAGVPGDRDQLSALCQISRRQVEKGRELALIDMAENDAKHYFDHHLPRIHRDISGMLPMDVIVGDVHPVDVTLHRDDGSEVYARAICWHDLATNRLWITIVILEKGEGVRREHVAASFASMCDSWGLPVTLYLDNGSEYNWAEMLDGFSELARLAGGLKLKLLGYDPEAQALTNVARQVVRARPYNAPAKAIEGLFAVMEQQHFALLPGWVGGQRMSKKTQNVGQAPKPFPGTWDQFHEAVDVALADYHGKPQHGFLGGKSPRETLQVHINNGWAKTAVTESVLLMAFASEYTRKADRGYISVAGVDNYYHDDLLPYTGKRFTVRVAWHQPEYAFVFDGARLLCVARPDQAYHPMDPAGAKEQSRRAGVLRRWITSKKRDCDRLDLVAEAARHDKHLAPMPESPTGATVSVERLDQMVATVEADARESLSEAARRANPAKLSQWSESENPDLAGIDWEDE